MRSSFLVALLLPLCWTHPVSVSDKDRKVDAKADYHHDETHSNEETHSAHNHRGEKLFSHNEIVMGDINVSGTAQGDDILSIGHQLEININAHDHGGHAHDHGGHSHDHGGHPHDYGGHAHDHGHVHHEHPALLIIDLQNDFITGSLKVPDATDIIGPISLLAGLPVWHKVVLSKDWHPSTHISFFSNLEQRPLDSTWKSLHPGQVSMFDEVIFAGPPPQEQVLWPDHCVQGTQGAEIHKDLVYPDDANIILKGTNPEVDSYSAFFDNSGAGRGSTGLDEIMENVTEVVVVGLATDYCVGSTAIDALSLGIPTTLLKDLSKPVTVEGEEDMLRRVKEAGGKVSTVEEWLKDLRIN